MWLEPLNEEITAIIMIFEAKRHLTYLLFFAFTIGSSFAQRPKMTGYTHGVDFALSQTVPGLSSGEYDDLLHESLSYSIVAGDNFRVFLGVNFLLPPKKNEIKFGFQTGFLSGSKKNRFGIIYGPNLFYLMNRIKYSSGAIQNQNSWGFAFSLGCYFVPWDQIVISTKISPAVYNYSIKDVNDKFPNYSSIPKSEGLYFGYYDFISLSVGYRF